DMRFNPLFTIDMSKEEDGSVFLKEGIDDFEMDDDSEPKTSPTEKKGESKKNSTLSSNGRADKLKSAGIKGRNWLKSSNELSEIQKGNDDFDMDDFSSDSSSPRVS